MGASFIFLLVVLKNFDYLCNMFVRVKKNRSGSSSVLVGAPGFFRGRPL